MDIEGIATRALQNYVGWSENMAIEVSTNDKTPFTDGHIDLYRGSRSNKNFLGRTPIQVKGARHKKQFPEVAKYKVQIKHASGWQLLRGVILFVVLIKPKSREAAIYYNALNPLKLQNFIKNAGPQEKKTISLKRLPEDHAELTGIVDFAIRTQDETDPIIATDEIFGSGATLTLTTTSLIDFSKPVTVDTSMSITDEYSVSIRTREGLSGTLDGTLTFFPPSYIDHELAITIGAGEHTFSNPLGRQTGPTSTLITPSPCLSISLSKKNEIMHGEVKVTNDGSVSEFLQALSFMISCHDCGHMRINGESSRFEVGSAAGIDDLRRRRNELDRIMQVLDKLHIPTNLLSAKLPGPREHATFEVLHKAIVLGEPVTLERGETGRISLDVCGWSIEIFSEPSGDEESWRLSNPFDLDWPRKMLSGPNDPESDDAQGSPPHPYHEVTAYELLDPDRLGRIVNTNTRAIVAAYNRLPDNIYRRRYANRSVLNLILAADSVPERRKELLKAACELNGWLELIEPESSAHLINRWQIEARTRPLSELECSGITKMMHLEGHGERDDAAKIGYSCAKLLGSERDAKYFWGRLSIAERDEVAKWPISNLRKMGNEGIGKRRDGT